MLGDADRDMLKHLTSVSREARGQQKDEVTDDEGDGESGEITKGIDQFTEESLNLGANRKLDPKFS